ncbi:phosphoribosylglycinamide formyltransferase [Myxococcota bacterium]
MTEATKQRRAPIAVFVSGGGSNLEAILAACDARFVAARVVAVVSDQPDAHGLTRARRRGIPALAVDVRKYETREAHEEAVLEALAPYAPRLAVLAGYMRMITPVLLRYFSPNRAGQLGVINIHPADTRAYQGVHGYEFAMGLTRKSPERLEQTFITVHFVDEGMDTGPILAQVPVPVHPKDTLDQLKDRGLAVEHQLYPRVIAQVVSGLVALQDGKVVQPGE